MSQGLLLGKQIYQCISLQIILVTPSKVKLMGKNIIQIIWKDLEVIKPFLAWQDPFFQSDLSFNNHSLWRPPLILHAGKTLAKSYWFLPLRLFI
jgi:hypothetical protein